MGQGSDELFAASELDLCMLELDPGGGGYVPMRLGFAKGGRP